jgi:Pentapeptide repeats (8 copies)
MANEEHLAKLREGPGAWNRWRTEHADVGPDLSDVFLSNLSGAYLSRADLVEADLSGANLRDQKTSHAGTGAGRLQY